MKSFGPFRLDAANQRVFYGSAETQLSQKATAILEILTKRPNEVVTHDELLDSAWQGVHVQPEVLKVYIAEIRRALRESAHNPRYIQTAHRRGYRLVTPASGVGNVQRKLLKSERLIGRSHEINQLLKLMRKGATGQRQTVFITGEAGIGKTALMSAFHRRATGRPGVITAWGQVAHARGETEPFSPVLDALGELLAGDHAAPLIAAFRQNAPGWLLQFPFLVKESEISQLGRQLTGSTSQRMIREFDDALDRCCKESLIVLGLDDLHHADPSTLDLLEYVASSPTPANLLIIGAADTREGSNRLRSLIATLRSRGLCEEIELEPFSEDSVRRFLEIRYPKSPVRNVLADRLYRLSGGIPLFLCSVVQYLETQQWILKTEGGWIPTAEAIRLEELVPPVLKDLVELKLHQLSPDDQQILEAASIVGTQFPSYLVADALEKPVGLVEETCNRIVREGGLLESAGFAPAQGGALRARFQFDHVVSREVLYCRQSEAQRVERHRRVAVALEAALGNRSHGSASELALHFTAGQSGSKSIEYLRAAAATASRRYAGAEAAALLTEAIRLVRCLPRPARVTTELEVLDELGAASFACGDFNNCARAWHEVATRAMKHGRLETAMRAISRLAFPVGWDKPALLRSVAERTLAQVHSIDDPITRAEITIRALTLSDIGGGLNPAEYARAADVMGQIARDGDRVRIASARVQYAWFQLRNSDYEGAIAGVEESLTVALQHDLLDLMRAEWTLGWALLHAGQWGRMQSLATAAAAHAQKNGSTKIEALFKVQLAWLHVECGAYQSAQSLCRRAVELSGNPTRGVGVVMRHVIMARAAIGLNDPAAALEHARRAMSINLPTETFWRSIAEICVLQAHLLKHSVPAIQESAHRLVGLATNLHENTWKAIAFAWCAQAAEVTDQEKLAREYSHLALQLVHGAQLPLAKWRVEAVAANIRHKSQSGAHGDSDSAQLRDKSNESRQKLFNSLGIQDPLTQFAKSEPLT